MPVLRIRQERIKRGWTQECVGKALGITLSAVQKIETGQRKPSYDVLMKAEDLFNISYRQLFVEADEAFE